MTESTIHPALAAVRSKKDQAAQQAAIAEDRKREGKRLVEAGEKVIRDTYVGVIEDLTEVLWARIEEDGYAGGEEYLEGSVQWLIGEKGDCQYYLLDDKTFAVASGLAGMPSGIDLSIVNLNTVKDLHSVLEDKLRLL